MYTTHSNRLICCFNRLFVNATCLFDGREYKELSNWLSDCSNCTCIKSIPFCEQIQCKYEPCEQGKQLILKNDRCCPVCEDPKKACDYDGYLINHNTEFTPKICTTCRCKDGLIECSDSCTAEEDLYGLLVPDSNPNTDEQIDESSSVRIIQLSSSQQRPSASNQHRHLKTRTNQNPNEAAVWEKSKNPIQSAMIDSAHPFQSVCYHDGKLRLFNSTWSPLKCTQCRCAVNSVVDCYVLECPQLNCSMGFELEANSCCPKCREEIKSCNDNGIVRKSGDYWSRKEQPCVHCSCVDGQINCVRENCTQITCPRNEILVTKSNRCCPQCESQMSENCEYFGRIHYNGEMWYTQGCQHCACNSGRVVCMNVQCESQFCLRDEIMVKKKDECCVSCRKLVSCKLDDGRVIKENEVWLSNSTDDQQKQSPNSCRLCKCSESGELYCFTKSCIQARFPSYARLSIPPPDAGSRTSTKEINARTIPFLADFIKIMRKDSIVMVAAGPKLASSSLYTVENKKQQTVDEFTIRDLALSKVFYQYQADSEADNEDDSVLDGVRSDFAQLIFISADNQTVHSVLIEFEIGVAGYGLGQIKGPKPKDDSLLSRSIKGVNSPSIQSKRSKQTPRKTILLHPGEAIKLTSAELKPKKSLANPDKLVYFLVSGAPKFGDLKLKKVLPLESVTTEMQLQQQGWVKVNDIYLEKSGVREFTQLDLDNGNVWYEPYNDVDSISTSSGEEAGPKRPCRNRTEVFGDNNDDEYEYNGVQSSVFCDELDDMSSIYAENSINGPEASQQAKYDHCMFEVYNQDKLDELISKEIIHFSIQKEIINETVLGLEVIENQITPLTFSNFDIAGIDISREYLIYKIIKSLEKDQGQLEHVNRPGVAVQTFTQHDLNAGHILYYSPKEIGASPREFFFTFIVTNDNRSDTFPETPFHIKCLPSNDQAPAFVHVSAHLMLQQGSSLVLTRDLFDVIDPDTQLDNLVFTLERAPTWCVLEMRSSRGTQRHLLSSGDAFTIQDVRDATFRIVHSAGDDLNEQYQDEDSFTLAVSDQKHVAVKTVSIEIKRTDREAPRAANKTTMLLSVREGSQKTIRRENLAFVDDRSQSEQILFRVAPASKTTGRVYLRDKILTPGVGFTQADIDLQNLRYESPLEIGSNILTESVYFDVSDKDGNSVKDQLFTIKVEPVDNQAPIVELVQQPVRITEGGYLLLNESIISVRDIDSSKEQLNVIIDAQPSFGYIENLQKGVRLSSFSVIDLIDGLTVRYVQADHKNKEPNHDSFVFHVSDGINESPTNKLLIDIEPVNDEQPVAIFEPLQVEYNKRTPITNASFFIVDFDSKPDELEVTIEEFPKHGRLYFGESLQLTATGKTKFTYSDVLDQMVSYRLDEKLAQQDEMRVRVSDGLHSSVSKYFINRVVNYDSLPVVEKNEGLQAISGHIFQITDKMLKYKRPSRLESKSGAPSRGRGGIPTVGKHKYDGYLASETGSEDILYTVITAPAFGKLQYRYEGFFDDIAPGPKSFISSFSQKDIDQGRVFYNHAIVDPTGATSMGFNVSDADGNVLGDQRFIITVRGDKLPPVVVHNKGIKVNMGQSALLTRFELDVRDDDTQIQNVRFLVVTQPKLGRLENTKEPGKRIDAFTYSDLSSQRIKYVQTETGPYGGSASKEDRIDLKITDGKNEAAASVPVAIVRADNQMPTLYSAYSMRVQELERRSITTNEIRVVDPDTHDDQIKIIITHPPQYGTIDRQSKAQNEPRVDDKVISIDTSANQKLNFILKFNNLNPNKTTVDYVTVNEFSMSDVKNGLISYKHRSPGAKQDRFGFVVFDGFNNMFAIDSGVQVSNFQIFNIDIGMDQNHAPKLEKNLGLDYLYQIDGQPGRLITKNELLIVDKDDPDTDLSVEITRKPAYGSIEHKDRPGVPLFRFTQQEISSNKIYYLIRNLDDKLGIYEDYFEFDVRDSTSQPRLQKNKFDIRWSYVNFEEAELSVMEAEGKARVHIKKTGYLKQFSMVSCRTQSHSAKSNRDTKQYDFVHTHTRLEFNEDESYKACDIVLNKDDQTEPIESFWVQLEEAKYSIIGLNNRIKVNILDKKRESIIEFEQAQIEVQENSKFVSLPILRSGELGLDVWVECVTRDESALSHLDYIPRNPTQYQHQQLLGGASTGAGSTGNSMVKIPAGEMYGFCDIEIVDDDLYEVGSEVFRAVLVNPSFGARLGSRSEASIVITGPNDILINDCNTLYYTVGEQSGKVFIEVTRENSSLNETLEVLVENIETSDVYLKNFLISMGEGRDVVYSDVRKRSDLDYFNSISTSGARNNYSGKNITIAAPNIDYEPVRRVIKFSPGEVIKKFHVNILSDSRQSENLKIFTIHLKPLNPIRTSNQSQCSFINPDFVNIVIEQSYDKNILVGFNQTSRVFVNETSRYLDLAIVRQGDLSKPFSVMCYTRGQTASEGKDFMPRGSFEQSRVYFEPGDKTKNCTVEILNDSIFEADETFQVKLSDLRTPASSNIRFSQFNTITVTILNEEDASVISLSEDTYHTEEPSSADSSVVKPVTIVRSGDLSRTTLVRISTSDDTAQAGLDYKPKTETIKFAPGVSALDFDIEIFHDDEREGVESFRVVLGPQDPVSGVYGRYKSAKVIIKDSSMLETSGLIGEKGQNDIYIDSLVYFVDRNGTLGREKSKGNLMVPNGEPLICLEPCDVKNPSYLENSAKCGSQSDKQTNAQYSWEISTPNEFGTYSSYTKLTDNSIFSLVNESILESIYFQPKFRIRCLVQSSRFGKQLKSDFVEVTNNPIFINHRCLDQWRLKTQENSDDYNSDDILVSSSSSSVAYYYSEQKPSTLTSPGSSSHRHNQLRFTEKPFLARADYISADYIKNNPHRADIDFLNYVRLEIEVPYLEGTIPLISTQPLQEAHNLRHLLNGNDSASGLKHHVCSNFAQHTSAKYGFIRGAETYFDEKIDKNEIHQSNKWLDLVDLINSHRSAKTLSFYSSLDANHCSWHFVAYYDITELTTHCAAQLISSELDSSSFKEGDKEINNDDKSHLTIKIPLYVSYLYAGHQGAWTSLDYKSSVEASIIYKTKSLYGSKIDESKGLNLNQLLSLNGFPDPDRAYTNIYDGPSVEKNEYLVSLSVSKISMTEAGKLVIDFSTIPAFHGQFVKYHPSLPNQESRLLPPSSLSNVKFNLELVWSQYTYDYPEQTWKATSDTVLNDFSGNFTIILIPCYAKQDQPFKYPFDCEPRDPFNYSIPIAIEQSIMPVSPKYSLGTKFNLFSAASRGFDGYFRRADQPTANGVLTWSSMDTSTKDYNLSLTKVFICSSSPGSDYTPLYDPDGSIYNRGPQFGCAREHPSLRHRFLILDRTNQDTNSSAFEARFMDGGQQGSISDGFRFNTSGLFDLTAGQQDSIWYVHVFFVIRPSHSNNQKQVFNNGTNMQIMRLTSAPRSPPLSSLFSSRVKGSRNKILGNKMREHSRHPQSYSDYFVKIVLPVIVGLVFVVFALGALVYFKREPIYQFLFVGTGGRRKSNREKAMNARSLDLLNYAKTKLKTTSPGSLAADANDAINTSENYSGSNSTSDTMVVVAGANNNHNHQVSPPQSPPNNAESNLTFQTLTNTIVNNSAGSSTLSHRHNNAGNVGQPGQQIDEDDENDDDEVSSLSARGDNDDENEYGVVKKNKRMLSFGALFKRLSNFTRSKNQRTRNQPDDLNLSNDYDNDETTKRFLEHSNVSDHHQTVMTSSRRTHNQLSDEESCVQMTRNFTPTSYHQRQQAATSPHHFSLTNTLSGGRRHPNTHHPQPNNYLYFNYNNNKMTNYFSHASPIEYSSDLTDHDAMHTSEILIHSHQNNNGNKLVVVATSAAAASPVNTAETIAAISSLSSSTPTQITPVSSTTNCGDHVKRLSGTEV